MNWKLGRIKAAFEQSYNRDFRYAEGMRGSMMTLCYEIIPDDEICDDPFGADDEFETTEWPRRFIHGVVSKKTGIRTFTTPRVDRLQNIIRYVSGNGMLTALALGEHRGDMDAAINVAHAHGFDRYADQSIMAGAIWGDFISTEISQDEASYVVLMWHKYPREPYFRVREIAMRFVRPDCETLHEFKARVKTLSFDHCTVNDLFGSVGTQHGSVFSAGTEPAGYTVDSFGYDNKGHRIISLQACSNADNGGHAFRLLRKPADIDLSLEIQRKILGL